MRAIVVYSGDDVIAHLVGHEGAMIVLDRFKLAAHIDQARRSADRRHSSMGRVQFAPVPRVGRFFESPQEHQFSTFGTNLLAHGWFVMADNKNDQAAIAFFQAPRPNGNLWW